MISVDEKEEDATRQAKSPASVRPIRWLAVLAVALPLIVLNCAWIANSEMRTGVTEVTISSLFTGILFFLFTVTLLNLVVRRIVGARAALGQAELMALYTLLSMSSVVAGVGHFGFFTTFLANPFYYNTPANGWQAFWYLLPSCIGPRDPAILKGFYEGHSTFFRPEVMAAWAYPLIPWSVFFLVLIWTSLCLSAILRRRWAEEEHLPFPVIALPLEMTREGAPLYRSKLLWIGFAFPCALHTLNSFSSILPGVPSLPIGQAHDLVRDASLQYPWNAAGSIIYMLHASGIGFGYLVNTDISFSLWFFYLLKKAVSIWGASMNWRDPATGWFVDANPQFPYVSSQGWGAWLTLGLTTLWLGRENFSAYVKRAFRGDPAGVDAGEAMSARVAVFGFAAGFLALCAFVWTMGGSWWLPVAFLGVYVLLMVTLTRIRAETPVLCSELFWINPQSILTGVLGAGALSQADLAHTSMLSWFNLDYRAAPMPHEMEGLVGLKRAGGRLRPMVPALLLAAAVAMIAALLFDLQMYYTNGAATGHVNGWRIGMGSKPWNELANHLHNPKAPDGGQIMGMIAGIAMTVLLSALRARFVSFPLHPAAYAMNMSFANDFFWCDMFVAWLVKVCILRYGGYQLYRQALPLFFGLILGDFVTGSVWSLIGTLMHLNLYRTFAS